MHETRKRTKNSRIKKTHSAVTHSRILFRFPLRFVRSQKQEFAFFFANTAVFSRFLKPRKKIKHVSVMDSGPVVQFECSVCLEKLNGVKELNQPRLLTCGHSFCFGCMKNLAKIEKICCPVCRETTLLGKSGVVGLKKNFALLEVLKALANPEPSRATQSKCPECDSSSQTFCAQCPGTPALCFSCFSALHTTPKRKTHILSQLTERQALICLEHNEECKLYCLTDNVLVCLICAQFGVHKGHSIDPIATAAKILRSRVREAQEQTDFKRAIVANSLVNLRQQEMRLQIQQVQLNRAHVQLQQCLNESCHNVFLAHWAEIYALDPSLFVPKSSLLKNDHWSLLKSWLPKEVRAKNFKLLYRGSQDGFTSQSFQERCDGKAPIIVVAHTKKGKIVGGFTPSSWDSECVVEKPTFIFILSHPKTKPQYLGCHQNMQRSSVYPAFGNDFSLQLRGHGYSHRFLYDEEYEPPSVSFYPGSNFASPNPRVSNFNEQIKDIEVFSIQ